MTALNWLHFTDRHVGSRDAWAWNEARKHLLEDLAELSRRQAEAGHGPWDEFLHPPLRRAARLALRSLCPA